MRRTQPIIVALAMLVAVAPLGASASHDTSPSWTPAADAIVFEGAGTGETVCLLQTVVIIPKEVTFNIDTQTTSGVAVVEGRSFCRSVESGVIADITVSLYQQSGTAWADPSTIGPSHPGMTLLATLTCTDRDPLADNNTCTSPPIRFANGPGTRLVGANGTLYRLVDPRGGAWFLINPLCIMSAASRASLYCQTSADLRV